MLYFSHNLECYTEDKNYTMSKKGEQENIRLTAL